jgi:hypothetical protein
MRQYASGACEVLIAEQKRSDKKQPEHDREDTPNSQPPL